MKTVTPFFAFALVIALSGCQLAGDIFKAGFNIGVFVVIAVIGLIIFIIAKAAGGR